MSVTDPAGWENFDFAPIVASASGDTLVVAAVPGKRIVVYAFYLASAGTVSYKWRSAANDKSGVLPLVANSFHDPDAGGLPLLATNRGEALNINLSAAIVVGGGVVYALQ